MQNIGKNPGKQPPHLSPQDQGFVKPQQFIDNAAAIDQTGNIDQTGTQNNVEHQVCDTLIPVSVAKNLKISAKFFQQTQLLLYLLSYQFSKRLSINEL
jgi:hypothetical protein